MKASPHNPFGKNALPIRRGQLGAALLWAVVACNGQLGDGPAGPSGGESGPSSGVLGGTGAIGTGGAAGAGGDTGGIGSSLAVDPGTKGLHRLNSTEYNATVLDTLGTKLQPANSSWLGGEIHGFDNIAAVLDVDAALYQRYFDSAIAIADDVFASPDLKAKIVTCAARDASCLNGIISTTGRRLFRRPLSTEEVATFSKVYNDAQALGEGHDGSLKQVLRAFLSSAEFLFRIESDPRPNQQEKHPLNGYELASRLSYFLWSSAPDDTLFAAAADNSISRDEVLQAQVDRMLKDPVKGNRFIENFVGQWLGARKLPAHAADTKVFPDWSPEVASSLAKEMYLYFAEFVKSDRPWSEFMTADINFIDSYSAKIYGVSAQGAMQRREITTDNRFGFAGLAGFLAMSSLPARTSPTLRGRWVIANLLCQEPPPPPPGVPDLGAGGLDPSKNVRVALEEHRKNPTCAACHNVFDPFGLSLEKFDGIGKYRASYSDGSPIMPTATRGGVEFSGLEGLADVVSKDPKFSVCVADFMFTYSLGREITESDRPYLHLIQEQWKKGAQTLRRLIQQLVLAETFRSRHGVAAK
jgi:hypothetical protein